MPTWALWVACLALCFLRALVAAAESALYGTSDLRAQELAEENGRGGQAGAASQDRARGHRHRPAPGHASSAASWPPPSAPSSRRGCWTSPGWRDEAAWLPVATVAAGALFVGVLASLMEVTMRGLANAGAERWALRLSGLVSLLVLLFYPPMRVLLGVLNLVARTFGRTLRFEPPPPPLEELEKLLAAQAANNEVDKSAPQLIRSIFELSDKRCRDVMVPRTEVVTVDVSTVAHRGAAPAGRGEPLAHPRLPR